MKWYFKCYLFLWNNKITFAWFILIHDLRRKCLWGMSILQWKIGFWNVVFGIHVVNKIFQWLPGDSDALLSGCPSWLRVSPASILPSIPEFSDDCKIWLSGHYTFIVIPLLLNGSTVQCTWYSYCSLKFEELICFLHHVRILFFLPQNLHFMPDPCVVDINNVIFGLTSSDVMFQLGAEEISL